MKGFLPALAVTLLAATAAQAADFAEVDANADGLVNFDEARAAMPDIKIVAFVTADADKDGVLNTDEFGTLEQNL